MYHDPWKKQVMAPGKIVDHACTVTLTSHLTFSVKSPSYDTDEEQCVKLIIQIQVQQEK